MDGPNHRFSTQYGAALDDSDKYIDPPPDVLNGFHQGQAFRFGQAPGDFIEQQGQQTTDRHGRTIDDRHRAIRDELFFSVSDGHRTNKP